MLLPVACRFVPHDQWLVTHLDDGAKVRQAKLWILAKCSLVQSPGRHPRRAVSPIVFASARSRSSLDSLDDGYNEDDEFSDQELAIYPHRDPTPGPAPQPGTSPLVDQYTLLSFSTGSLLEDEFALSWYNLRPYELLEMHPVGTVAPLQRHVLAHYVQPYFQAKARVLRVVWNHKSGRFEPPRSDPQREHGGHTAMDKLAHRFDTFSTRSNSSQSEKRHKTKVDWKSRWVVINQGILFLCKEHVTNPPLHQFALSTMTALRGADAFERAFSIATRPRLVCINFRRCSPSLSGVASPPSSPISEELKTSVQEDAADDLKQTTELEDPGEYAYDPNDTFNADGEWVVLDMLDDPAFSSILRILHRQASHPISSSFVPSSSMITVSHHSVPSPAETSFASYDTIPYPEWRVNTVENARKAGMGDVGKAMAWVLWTDKGLGESLLGNIRHHRQAFSREMQYKTPIPSGIYCVSDDESDDESELEWEGWMRDLERQGQVKRQTEKSDRASRSAASSQAHIPGGMSSSLPSPPLSQVSPSGSPRVRSPSLSLTAGSFGSHLHTQYPNIGNVIQASGVCSTEPPHSPEKNKSTTISTVSVGTAPSSRRRSTTLLSGTTKRNHDKGTPANREPFPSSSARITARTAGQQYSPNTSVRHVRSSSNLRVSSSPYGSDAAESGHPGPSSPSKRQNAFIRGMSLRAGKLVRGLESAIDFVDEKTI